MHTTPARAGESHVQHFQLLHDHHQRRLGDIGVEKKPGGNLAAAIPANLHHRALARYFFILSSRNIYLCPTSDFKMCINEAKLSQPKMVVIFVFEMKIAPEREV